MATTLGALRAKLNGECGVLTDGETTPWSTTVRNQAISDAYAELWTSGVWRDARQDFATVTDQYNYALTSIRRAYRIELLDSASRVFSRPTGIVEPDGAGAGTYQLALKAPVSAGDTLRVRGWAAYKSVFSGDSDPDDLAAEYNRIPLLKAKAILYRIELSKFARFGGRQALPPEMNVSAADLFSIIAAAEREYEARTRTLAGQRPRAGQLRDL